MSAGRKFSQSSVVLSTNDARYCTALEDFRNLLSSLGYDPMSYGEHSGKRGGASEAASAGLSLPDLQRLGGWHSQTMPAKYTDVPVVKRIHWLQACCSLCPLPCLVLT